MTKILAIETSTDACSVALWYGDKKLDRFVVAKQQHTKLILPMINELLTEAQLALNQLDVIAFGCGPGSFTGVRLAASITQGLAFAAQLPVIKISSLRALAQEAFEESQKSLVLVVQDARMQEVYWGEYQVDANGIMQSIVSDQLIVSQKISTMVKKDFVGVGDGWKIYDDILTKRCNILSIENRIYPKAKYVAQLTAADFAKGLTVSAEEALPVYLREEVTH
jgi:tRNA threonylcarbamoyladenosine biosynthesis protein TsaB